MLDDLKARLLRDAAVSKQADGAFRLQQEKRLKKRLAVLLKRQQDFVLREIKKLSFLQSTLKNEVSKQDREEINLLVSRIPEKSAIVDALAIYWQASMLRGGKSTVRQLKLGQAGISFSLQNKNAIKWLKAKKILETAEPGSAAWKQATNILKLSNYRGNIDFTTKTRVKDILIEAAENGYSYQQTSKLIQAAGNAGVFSQARGELIATQELAGAYERGKKIPMEDFAEEFPDRKPEKKWNSVLDGRETPECRDRDKQGWKPLDWDFIGYDTPPGHIRCRCSLTFRIQSPKQ